MSDVTHHPFRVALLLRAPVAPAWVADLASALCSSDDYDVTAVALPRADPAPSRGTGATHAGAARSIEAYRQIRSRFLRIRQDPFRQVDLRRVVPSLRLVELAPAERLSSPLEVDVAVASDRRFAGEDLASRGLTACLGVWYSHELDRADGLTTMTTPAGRAALKGDDDVGIAILAAATSSAGAATVASARCSLDSPLASKSKARAAWGAASLMLTSLERAARVGAEGPAARGRSEVAQGRHAEVWFTEPEMTDLTGADLVGHCRRVLDGVVDRASRRRQWILAYRTRESADAGSGEDVTFLIPPDDAFWADPHVVRHQGDRYIFFEEYPYGRGLGRIAVVKVRDGRPEGGSRVVLSAETHLSYPFVFSFGGEWYMVPESMQTGRIDLFRADRFPDDWVYVKSLMRDVSAVDTTLYEHDGRWWLFTCLERVGGETGLSHLYLFSAASPLSDSWEAHPMNPIASGCCGVRPAGRLFWDGERLIRPAQDSRGFYGRRVCLQQVEALTSTEYRERTVSVVAASEARGFIGLHTLSEADGLTAVDLCRRLPRL